MRSLEPIFGLTTQRILSDFACIGHLYAPKNAGDQWEVWPRYRQPDSATDDRLDVGDDCCARFDTEADALAFLGLGFEQERLAA